MKNVLLAMVCTASLVACAGENRPAESPSASTETTTVTTETSAAGAPAATGQTLTSATHANGETGKASSAMPQNGATGKTMPLTAGTGPSPSYGNTNSTDSTTAAPVVAANPGSADNTKDATNTKTNDRDRHGALTPMDQGGGHDRDITATIRRAVVGDSSLSFNAKNVKIITVGGKVTLRGPVKTDAERSNIESKAKSAPGVTEVDNQLEVKK